MVDRGVSSPRDSNRLSSPQGPPTVCRAVARPKKEIEVKYLHSSGKFHFVVLSALTISILGTSDLAISRAYAARRHRGTTYTSGTGSTPTTSGTSGSTTTSPSSGTTTAPSSSSTPTTTAPTSSSFVLSGLQSPATVAESIFVNSNGVPSGATVSYSIDNVVRSTENAAPFWMGGVSGSSPNGFNISGLYAGQHTLQATATLADGSSISSNSITLNVVPSINSQFSSSLAAYANQPSAQQGNPSTLLANVTTSGASLTATELATRQAVMAMYLNWGIDPSLDPGNDESSVLASLAPKSWQAPASGISATSLLSMAFSPDAPYYHAIPSAWPKVQLPSGYIKQLQLNAAHGGDGIGYGETVAASADPQLTVTSEWYSDASTLRTFPFRMNKSWNNSIPDLAQGDKHVLFADPTTNTFVSTYMTSLNTQTGGPNALYASSPTSFNSLGDFGGSTAAKFSELPVMVQPGEATNPNQPIRHAIGGPVERIWGARVYPATARDAGMMTQTNPCGTSSGYTNNGLVPYGGVIQLDPNLDLTKLSLSLPAFRILQAMQTYGYYVMDFGCGDMDIYTAVSESEFMPYGGMYGNVNGPGVQNEVQKIIASSNLYVVAPLTKKQ